jgi:hypothetical protein
MPGFGTGVWLDSLLSLVFFGGLVVHSELHNTAMTKASSSTVSVVWCGVGGVRVRLFLLSTCSCLVGSLIQMVKVGYRWPGDNAFVAACKPAG